MSRIRGKAQPESCRSPAVVVGIDVGNGELDMFLHPDGERFHVDNDPAGIRRLGKRCLGACTELLVMEAKGRYHRAAHACLHESGLQVAVVNPYRSRRFADVLGRLAETLARFGVTMQPSVSVPPTEILKQLAEATVARRQVVEARISLEQQHSEASSKVVKAQIAERIELCRRYGKELDEMLLDLVRSDPQVARRFEMLTSVPGIGPVPVVTLLVEMKELGAANAAEVAVLAGLAPINRFRAAPGSKDDLRRTHGRAQRPLYGGGGRGALEPRPRQILSTASAGGQTVQGRDHRCHAEADRCG